MDPLDAEAYQTWIGQEDFASDYLTPDLVRRFGATFDLGEVDSRLGSPAPPGIHWCLAPPLVPTAALGLDGHPGRGGFLPPIPLPRRMWAGGSVTFGRPIRVGDDVRRRSVIADVVVKTGRAGPLCFVTLRHDVLVGGETAVSERQDIVYRALAGTGDAGPARESPAAPEARWTRSVEATAPLLFRYSALTFNGHRIHYDRRFCTEQEGYPGLVVHGPLQATLLVQLATETRGGRVPETFSFRSVAPLFEGRAFQLAASESATGLQLWTADHDGQPAMTAEARWG